MNQEIDLLTELVQAMGQDVAALRKSLANPPTVAPPADYRPALEALGQELGQVQRQLAQLTQRVTVPATPVAPPPPPVDLSRLEQRLEQIEGRQMASPAYVMSQAVRYGVIGFWLLVVALGAATWYCFDWKAKAEHYLANWTDDNWRVRYTQQANPAYYATMEGVFAQDAAKVRQWTYDQEQADEKRVLAQEAARQAQALRQQASQLERGKGSKASRR